MYQVAHIVQNAVGLDRHGVVLEVPTEHAIELEVLPYFDFDWRHPSDAFVRICVMLVFSSILTGPDSEVQNVVDGVVYVVVNTIGVMEHDSFKKLVDMW